MVAKAHHPANFSAGNAGHGFGLAVGVNDKLESARLDVRLQNVDVARDVLVDQDALVHGVAHTDDDGAIGLKAGLDGHEAGQLTQQQVALVQQLRGLAGLRAVFGQLFVHLGQLRSQGIDLAHVGVHRLAGFLVEQVELTCQLTESGGQTIGIAQKCAARDHRSRVGGQIASRFKKQVHGRGQANALVAHHVDQAVDIGQQRFLALQVAVAVAQVRLHKGVVLALHSVKTGACTQIAVADFTWLVGSQ